MSADQVRALIAEQLGLQVDRVRASADLRIDLGADSLDQLELVMALEEEFGVEIPEDVADRWRTVADVVATADGLAQRTGRVL